MSPNAPSRYIAPSEFLQQGDIFRLEVVTPVVSTEKRIFRAVDGRHADAVFSQGAEATVFEAEELQQLLTATNPKDDLHTSPFSQTKSGLEEMVVVHGQLRSYFVVASQTCDICGEDKDALPACIILPIVTVRNVCRHRLPLGDNGEHFTIEQFLETNAGATHLKSEQDDIAYPILLKKLLTDWQPPSKSLEVTRNKVRKLLNKKQQWIHSMKADEAFSVPFSYVDFSVAHTVPTAHLEQLKGMRIAQLAEPFRTHFAYAFAHRLSRIALPAEEEKDYF